MKHIKLFENFEENFKKYPNLFNLFVDPQYIKEEDFKAVDDLLNLDIVARPFYFDGKIYDLDGDVYLFNTDIKELPDNLTVGGDLNLSHSKIKELHNNLIVNGNLYLNNTNIKELPNNLRVDGDLYLYGTNIKDIPESAIIKGNIYRNRI